MNNTDEDIEQKDAYPSYPKLLQYVLSQHSGEIITPQLIEKIIVVFEEIIQKP